MFILIKIVLKNKHLHHKFQLNKLIINQFNYLIINQAQICMHKNNNRNAMMILIIINNNSNNNNSNKIN